METKIKCVNPKVVITLTRMEAIDIYSALMGYDEKDVDRDAYTVLRDEFCTIISTFEEIEEIHPKTGAFIFRSKEVD